MLIHNIFILIQYNKYMVQLVYKIEIILLMTCVGAIILSSDMKVYNCFSGANYMDECQQCSDKNMSYLVCSGSCTNSNNLKCGISKDECCYSTIDMAYSVTDMKCSYSWGLFGYFLTKHELKIWQQKMILENC